MQKLKWYQLAVTLLLSYLSYGQETGSITGKVMDKNNHPVEYANVFITTSNDTSKILNAAITDSAGLFLLTNFPDGEYLLHVQLIGFKKHSQIIIIEPKNRNISLSNLIVEINTTTLGRIEVTAFRNMIKKTEEGVVMNAADNLTQIGGNAADLLKNMPGVLVGADGGITLRGKNPLVIINGRVSGIGGGDRLANLEQIPASSIDRIEIITNPSAKYDADAEGGIINIILKKNVDRGTNGAFALGVGFGRRYRLNGTVLFNHKTEKWNVGFAYDNWYTTRTRSVNGDRIQFDVPNEYFLTQRRTDERTVKNQMARFTVDYVPDKKNSLSLEAVWLFQGENNHETLTSTTETAAYYFTGRNRRFSNEIRRFHTGEVTLNYKRKFNHPDRLLTLNVSSALDYDRENTLITTQTLSQQYKDIGDPWQQKTHNYENSGISSFSVDYAQPITETGLIETGYKAIFRIIDNDFLRQNPFNGSFVTDSLNTDIYNFNEQIHAAYAQYVGWVGEKDSPKWKYNVGLRVEQVWNSSNTELKPLKFSNDYFNLFPSASLLFYTQKRNVAKLSYSRRINRPSFGQLIPFIDITDSLNQHAGNPNLKPELVHSLELSYNHSFNTGSLTASTFYRKTSRVIMSIITLDSNGVALAQPMNFGNSTAYGVEGLIALNPFRFWSINLNSSVYNLHIENKGTADIQRNQVTWFLKLINNCTLWKNGKLQVTVNYTSPIAIPQGEQIEVYFADMGFQQKLMKGQGRLGLTVTDIFNTQKSGSRTSDNNFRYTRISKVDTRSVMLTFGYTFKSTFKENLMENKFKNE